jgi:hypothetical protein
MNQITKKTTSKLVRYKVWRRLHEYPSNNKLSKIVKLLIKRLFLGCVSQKQKLQYIYYYYYYYYYYYLSLFNHGGLSGVCFSKGRAHLL